MDGACLPAVSASCLGLERGSLLTALRGELMKSGYPVWVGFGAQLSQEALLLHQICSFGTLRNFYKLTNYCDLP